MSYPLDKDDNYFPTDDTFIKRRSKRHEARILAEEIKEWYK